MHQMTLPALIEAATKVQRSLCVYDVFRFDRTGNAADSCDCKYGHTQVGVPTETGNGCPEMREVVAILREMKPGELKAIQVRLRKKQKEDIKRINAALAEDRKKRRAKDTWQDENDREALGGGYK